MSFTVNIFIPGHGEYTFPSEGHFFPCRGLLHHLQWLLPVQVVGINKKVYQFVYLISVWANPEDSETWTGIRGGRCKSYLNIEQLKAVLSLDISDLLWVLTSIFKSLKLQFNFLQKEIPLTAELWMMLNQCQVVKFFFVHQHDNQNKWKFPSCDLTKSWSCLRATIVNFVILLLSFKSFL